MFFHQTFNPRDLLVVLLLVFLEGLLSIDNAVVLGLLARRLPENQRSRALTYGLIGAFIFRLFAVAMAAWLLEWNIVKLLGGGYLLYIAGKHLLFHKQQEPEVEPSNSRQRRAFWGTVAAIELTDIAFAIDSILAGIALVGKNPDEKYVHPKLWVVFVGGMFGVVLMRFAAALFIKLLDRFPRFELSAYLLVTVVGLKLLTDWALQYRKMSADFDKPSSPAFWIFWIAMAGCIGFGFLPKRKSPA